MKGLNKYSILFALFGFLGFKELNGDPLGLLAFGFFGNFAYIWWNKLGDYVMNDWFLINVEQAS